MAKKKDSGINPEARRKKAEKQQKVNDIVAYIVAGIALIAVVGLIIYSYSR